MSRRRPISEQTVFGLVLAALVAVAVLAPWLGWATAARFDETVPHPGGVGSLLRQLRETGWPSAATPWAVGYLVAFVLLGAAVIYLVRSGRSERGADLSARVREMPTDRRGLQRYLSGTGPLIGRVLGKAGRAGAAISATIEDQIIVIGGPRLGKSARLAIPWVRRHHGPVLATSNKRDIYDEIVQQRSAVGPLHLLDPEQIAAQGPPTWWWNPLEMATTVSGARNLARIWAQASRDADAKTDAFFDISGEELLASLLLAAAWHPERRVSLVYRWLTDPEDSTPESILVANQGFEEMSFGLASRRRQHEKTRAGVYASGETPLSWIADPDLRQWVEDRDGQRPCLSARDFARSSTETLVLLSKEGRASTAIVTALTAAVLQESETYASTHPGGRLPRPLLGLLDEAANVCRWRELPDLYSHYGSRGIILASFFQSGAQMVDGFGEQGAQKLWSAANVRMYLGGEGEDRFLERLSKLVGEHDETHWTQSASYGGGAVVDRRRSRSESTHVRKVATFDVATLAAFPRGHALVLLSATRPVVVELPASIYDARTEGPAA